MTKANFIDLMRHRLSGGSMTPDLESKYHKEIISLYISSAFNEIIYSTFRKSANDLDLYIQTFKNVPVFFDSELNVKYSILPSKVIQIPGGNGVRRISPMQESSTTFKPLSDNAKSVLQRADVGEIGVETWFSNNNDRIEYYNISEDITKVLVKIIVPFSELEDDDEFPTPSGADTKIFNIILGMMGEMPPQDLANDNNPKQV